MCLFLRYKLIPPACFLSKKIYIGIYIFFFIKGNVKKQSKYIQCGDFGKQNILLRHLYVQHRQSKSILRQPNNLREPYIYLLCMGHSTPITGRNCICTISCQLDTSTVFKMIYVICIAHSQGRPLYHRGSMDTVVSLSSFTTVLYFLLHKGFKLYDNTCSAFHYSHRHLRSVSVIGNLWKRQEIRIASS